MSNHINLDSYMQLIWIYANSFAKSHKNVAVCVSNEFSYKAQSATKSPVMLKTTIL